VSSTPERVKKQLSRAGNNDLPLLNHYLTNSEKKRIVNKFNKQNSGEFLDDNQPP
jgi:hypothetical protein